MSKHEPFSLTQFTPAEAEAITGVSTTMQRDWRRRGFLSTVDGHARFDLFDLAEMKAMHMLAFRGVGPIQSQYVRLFLGLGIAWHILCEEDSYSGDHDLTSTWSYSTSNAMAPTQIPWNQKGEWLAKYFLRERFGPITPANLFIWWANNEHTFHYSLDLAFADPKFRNSVNSGPAIIIDLAVAADLIMVSAAKPFVHVEYEIDPVTARAIAPLPAKSVGEQ
jgi:hypothetical protein